MFRDNSTRKLCLNLDSLEYAENVAVHAVNFVEICSKVCMLSANKIMLSAKKTGNT